MDSLKGFEDGMRLVAREPFNTAAAGLHISLFVEAGTVLVVRSGGLLDDKIRGFWCYKEGTPEDRNDYYIDDVTIKLLDPAGSCPSVYTRTKIMGRFDGILDDGQTHPKIEMLDERDWAIMELVGLILKGKTFTRHEKCSGCGEVHKEHLEHNALCDKIEEILARAGIKMGGAK